MSKLVRTFPIMINYRTPGPGTPPSRGAAPDGHPRTVFLRGLDTLLGAADDTSESRLLTVVLDPLVAAREEGDRQDFIRFAGPNGTARAAHMHRHLDETTRRTVV